MKMKSLFAALAAFTASFTSVIANDFANNGYMENAPGCCYEAPCYPNSYNPPAYLNCGNNACGGFFDTISARVDFLWWRASEINLELGIEDTLNNTVFSIDQAREKRPNFKFDPGYRIGLTTICPDGCWDAALNWTHFNTSARAIGMGDPGHTSGLIFIGPVTTFNSYWELNQNANPLDLCEGRWKLNMDLIDLEMAHRYHINQCLVLRPFVGLRGGRINQSYHIFSTFNEVEIRMPDGQYLSKLHARSNFVGVGPRIGLNIAFEVCQDLSVFGEAAGSILYGSLDRHTNENADFLFFTEEFTAIVVQESEGRLKAGSKQCSRCITDLTLGLRWDHCVRWCNHCHPVSLVAAWEFHTFYDFNNFLQRILPAPNNEKEGKASTKENFNFPQRSLTGNLYTQGLTLSVCIGF